MDASYRSLAEQACRALLATYAIAVDEGDAQGIVALFTPDGVIRRGKLCLRGSAQLPEILGGRGERTVIRHLLTTTHIRLLDRETAAGRAYYVLYLGSGPDLPVVMQQPYSLGDWHCRFRSTEAGWLLAELDIVRTFERGREAAPSALRTAAALTGHRSAGADRPGDGAET